MNVNLTAKNKANGVCVISLKGDIGAETVNDFKVQIDGIIKNSIKNYIMDFQDITYLNSIGVGAIAAALKKVKKFQGNIKLINVSSSVQELFEMTRLTKVFEIYDSEEDAIRSYESK
ncbi:MAG: STAS domain-containing protein [Candidatus Riflebacteria bacterium]|nr:STAS domain-containing protein [Candidatus Riflebacteria bacterium]